MTSDSSCHRLEVRNRPAHDLRESSDVIVGHEQVRHQICSLQRLLWNQ
jgi:hypothetical protein